jgi:hypothetical protein
VSMTRPPTTGVEPLTGRARARELAHAAARLPCGTRDCSRITSG